VRLRTFKETRPIAQSGGRRSQSLETGEESVRIDNRVAWARYQGRQLNLKVLEFSARHKLSDRINVGTVQELNSSQDDTRYSDKVQKTWKNKNKQMIN